MKEKLTIDQKIQIAQIASNIVTAGINNQMQPVGLAKDNPEIHSEQELFEHLYRVIVKTVSDEPEQN
ncbi:hypothetical protein K7D36_003645 [Salmonella enterica]|uniref:Uncharacterized protein n=1 Tax=Salmonella enterica I TaxID=59201 RepID=A0A8F6NX29_SALET|nr:MULTISPECIES: hypothetical protein [Enterobacteriaceae]ECS8252148.1 hypothetical protein [Salmonella enterica subsp. enterica serovar Waycross]ECS8495297.1 hypothetical protein [Salmonella enterica subsp. enterica serovar Give]ECX3454572.1 hypothetical protein [Salmonella enterica subsp. enterica serovar Rubislaw]ECZ3644412.1 hypothetical protein [Salmonella enterica subsp. enterica serovar Montevideo]EDI1468668.1 hypothetical protein [Salmonella enterica subsp. enterica serovar Newport]ED